MDVNSTINTHPLEEDMIVSDGNSSIFSRSSLDDDQEKRSSFRNEFQLICFSLENIQLSIVDPLNENVCH